MSKLLLKMDEPKSLSCKRSIFLKPSNYVNFMDRMRKFKNNVFHDMGGYWEIPSNQFRNVLEEFHSWDMEIIGELDKPSERILEMYDRLEDVSRIPYKFKTEPLPHQVEGFEYGSNNRRFLLGDEQGLGKTKQSIDIAVSRKHNFKHCLVVCGVNGLKWNWKNEINKHSHEKSRILGEKVNSKGKSVIGSVSERVRDLEQGCDEFFLITNIETCRDKEFAKVIKKKCQSGEVGMIIVDEIHKCKNPTSKQGKALQYLDSYYKIALTGTPIMNSPLDSYNVLKWLGVERNTWTQFKSYHCRYGGFNNRDIIGYKHMGELSKKIQSVMLRRKKDDVLDLPKKIRTIDYVEMDKKQSRLYEDIKAQILEDIDRVLLLPNPLTELIRLRQCTGFPGILSSSITKSVKLERMVGLVEEEVENGNKVIVFSNWTSVTDEAVKMLTKYNPATITGKTKDREEEEKRFQTDPSCKVIVGTIPAMGTGLTLTAGSTVIFLDSAWNAANKEQAEDRAHRIGTTKTVNIITIVAKDTIDEAIEHIIEQKAHISNQLVEGEVLKVKPDKDLLEFLLR